MIETKPNDTLEVLIMLIKLRQISLNKHSIDLVRVFGS